MFHRRYFVTSLVIGFAFSFSVLPAMSQDAGSEDLSLNAVKCEGDYQHHLQGVCTDDTAAIFWSFTTELVKTDRQGRVLKTIPVANHHGDLCFKDGKIYVAVNLGRFNDPKGNADSWVYAYDANTLDLVAEHEVQEVFHGAGGIGTTDGHFYVVGGLPDGVQENYVYEYDADFQFVKQHTLQSKWTHLGIQTATFHDGAWWFGCYGSPAILLKTDAGFNLIGRHEFNCSLGIIGVGPGRLMFAKGPRNAAGRHMGSLHLARPDATRGLVEVSTAAGTEQRPPQGVAPGIEKPLLIAPRPGNGRNSEGDFIQLKDGRLLLVYSKFTGTGDHAPAELVGRYSSDGGETWGSDDVPIIARTGRDANLMSVSLLRLADGRIALFYVRKYDSPDGSKYPYLDHILMRTSTDEGQTWSEPTYVVPENQPGYRVLNNDRVIQLKSGRLVVPLAVHYLPGRPGFQSSAEMVCYLSDDQGASWRASTSTLKSELLAQEPGVVELKDGTLLMFCRSRDCQLVARSEDGGDTWSPLTRSSIAQPTVSPASIERIPETGDLLLVWNNGNDPLAALKPVGRRPFTVAISKDDGATWQHIQNIGADPKGWYCYTAIEFVDDHLLLAHCEFPGLNSLQITRVPVSWLYKSNEDPQQK
ncbi:glycoside hydrolase [Stieleria sp. ICT_E10.1]|uniref:sialidase family protein n=1 Tax=Stieleria sedimenti TaxID=2976331 RepID=UPI00217F510E|nr:sialidase family protein [Stieleria sedimenti]MCS7465869.1 glycoside hydrolase [Stieleria sedimenti]